MKSLSNIKSIIEELLEKDIETRKDDMYLYSCACREYLIRSEIAITPEIETMLNVFSKSAALGLPNYESVRRVRAKIQSENPELVDEDTAKRRNRARCMFLQFI